MKTTKVPKTENERNLRDAKSCLSHIYDLCRHNNIKEYIFSFPLDDESDIFDDPTLDLTPPYTSAHDVRPDGEEFLYKHYGDYTVTWQQTPVENGLQMHLTLENLGKEIVAYDYFSQQRGHSLEDLFDELIDGFEIVEEDHGVFTAVEHNEIAMQGRILKMVMKLSRMPESSVDIDINNPMGFWFRQGDKHISWYTSYWSEASRDGFHGTLLYVVNREPAKGFQYQPESFYEEYGEPYGG